MGKLALKSGLLDLIDLSQGPVSAALSGASASSAGMSVTALTAMQVAAVYACVGILSETIAQLPIRVLRKRTDQGADEDRESPLFQLLYRKPNSWQTSFELREMAMQHLCLYGNFYAWKVRDGSGVVRELLPLPAGSVSVVQNPDWSLTYQVANEHFFRQATDYDIMHIRYRTLDGYRGISPIAFNRETVGLALATARHGSNLFKNGATPSGVLEHPGRLKAEAAKRLKEDWTAAHGGDNSGGVAVLEEGMKYNPLTMSQEDAQYIQTRQFTVEEIARIFRVPLHEIQSTQKTTSWGSGIEAMNIGFVTRTILPWVKRWEAAIQKDLVPESEPELIVKFNMEGLLRGDVKSRYEAYQIGINNGFMSPNEAREKEDLNPREGGDEYMTPLNMRTTNDDAAQAEPAGGDPALNGGDPDEEGGENGEAKDE